MIIQILQHFCFTRLRFISDALGVLVWGSGIKNCNPPTNLRSSRKISFPLLQLVYNNMPWVFVILGLPFEKEHVRREKWTENVYSEKQTRIDRCWWCIMSNFEWCAIHWKNDEAKAEGVSKRKWDMLFLVQMMISQRCAGKDLSSSSRGSRRTKVHDNMVTGHIYIVRIFIPPLLMHVKCIVWLNYIQMIDG